MGTGLRSRVRLGFVLGGLTGAALLAAMVGCSGKGAASAQNDRGKRDTKIRTEACSKSAGFDTNRDGKKDLFEVGSGGKISCRAVDLDFDGTVDQTTFFDPTGVVRRREIDLDGNGVPNLVETFTAGKLVLRSIDGASLGRFDMWDAYDPATGTRTTRERDTNGDGRVDEYWTFTGPRITVRFDRNDDGMPDEEGALVWGDGFESGGGADAGAPASATADAGTPPVAQAWTDAGTDKPQAAPEGNVVDGGATTASSASAAPAAPKKKTP